MKKTLVLFFMLCLTFANAQGNKRLFSKDPIINLENFQKQKLYFGFYMGLNGFDFKIDYKDNIPDILIKRSTGFNVGLVSDIRLQEYINLRFEPGLYYTKRDLYYPSSYFATTPTASDRLREVNSTYIHFPLLVKFSALRTGNVRPYLVGGGSFTLNLSSNAKSLDDNAEGRFRMKSWTTNYELGFGIDIFSEYFIFSPSIRGVFGINDELIRDKDPNSPWTSNIESIKNRAIFINFTFH
ncbi:porin family protein [Flavobacterium sp.]|jgi:hypothetical protein|uniref:type IX secretion/gliding motility protein PorT/SprT n=1 Tax=Flavobacterium sp. TaxID=239 RepID=UPI0022CC5168|nr:porin family protein [Flavobacterium sp.]MCZ8230454.1 porin family protein [Flavobacterium sp.]